MREDVGQRRHVKPGNLWESSAEAKVRSSESIAIAARI
jgi:hypothetical protein